MDFESVKMFVEKAGGAYDSLPVKYIEPIVMHGMNIDRIERGLILCSFTVPPRLLDEIEIESKPRHYASEIKAICCCQCGVEK